MKVAENNISNLRRRVIRRIEKAINKVSLLKKETPNKVEYLNVVTAQLSTLKTAVTYDRSASTESLTKLCAQIDSINNVL